MTTNTSETVIRNEEKVATQNLADYGATPHEMRRKRIMNKDLEELQRLEKEREEALAAAQRNNKMEELEDDSDESEETDEAGEDVDTGTTSSNGEEAEQAETADEQSTEEEEKSETKPKHDWEKRYKDLQREFTKLKQALKDKGEKEAEKILQAASKEDVDKWGEKYPGIYAIVRRIAQDSSEDLRSEMEKLNEIRQEILLQKAEQAVAEHHPDFDEIRSSAAFHEWVERKPKWISEALYENLEDTNTVVEILSMYKTSPAYKPKTPKKSISKEVEAARSVKTTGQSTVKPKAREKRWLFSESQIDAMSLAEFAEKEKEIDEARRQGKVLMDRSGAAMM